MAKKDSDQGTRRTQRITQHWIHWVVNLLCVIGAGIFLIPYFRSQPASVHEFALGLSDWQRHLFIFAICVTLVGTLCHLFSPRLSHLQYFRTHPPAWSAWLLSGLVLCGLDLGIGLSRDRYAASLEEWLVYGGGAIFVVFLVRWFICYAGSIRRSVSEKKRPEPIERPLDWTTLELWLQSDAPASNDFLGNYSVAERLSELLANGVQSIGIVAPFGAGKSSIVKWIEAQFEDNKVFISEHNCWGFETSLASIHAMLADAIRMLAERIDTFQISSLPDSYRQTFSAGGELLDKISGVLFRQRDPIEQFHRLSALLGDLGMRLIFVVEDLDRNDSRSFDIQEVLAFLQQLKGFNNLSFILTGGLNTSPRIDYGKLCDRIEYLRTISEHQSGELVGVLRKQCLNQSAFPHTHLTDPDNDQWQPNQWLLLSGQDDVSPPEAIARLLKTPRAIRHALSLTYCAWRNLYGEIDFDHLLAVKVLRYASPEAFSFLLRHWHDFRDQPTGYTRQNGDLDKITASLQLEWEEVSVGADWDRKAARTLIDLILPLTPMWLDKAHGGSQPRAQGIQYERYWQRALNEYIAPGEVRDQIVIRDMQQWIKAPALESALVTGICSNSHYSDVWEDLAVHFFSGDLGKILRLCEQVLEYIRHRYWAEASDDSQGFIPVWRYANRHAGHVETNAEWLEEQITESASVSLALVNSLWHYWGSEKYTILRYEDRERVRRHMINILQQELSSAESLAQVTHLSHPYVFYHLVFDPGQHGPVLADPKLWSWMGPVLLEGLECGQVTTAIGVCILVAARDQGDRREPTAADPLLIATFFEEKALQAVDALERLLPQIDEKNRLFVSNIVQSARAGLTENSAFTG